MREEEVINREKESAKDTAENLDQDSPLDALIAMTVYKTLRWVEGEGEEKLDDELMEMSDNDF